MASAGLKMASLCWPLLALTFASWVVALGGLSSAQHTCSGAGGGAGGAGGFGGATNAGRALLQMGSDNSCSSMFQFWWWVIAFQFVVMLMMAVICAIGHARKARMSMVGMFSVATLLTMLACDTFLITGSNPLTGKALNTNRTLSAGWIMTTICNLFMVMFLGWEWECEHKAHETKPAATAGMPGQAPAPQDPMVHQV